MISTKLKGPAEEEVVEVVLVEEPPALELAGRISRNTTDSPVLPILRKLPVIGMAAAPAAPADELEVAPVALPELLADALPVVVLVLPVVPDVLAEAPVPVKNVPLHWFCVSACW